MMNAAAAESRERKKLLDQSVIFLGCWFFTGIVRVVTYIYQNNFLLSGLILQKPYQTASKGHFSIEHYLRAMTDDINVSRASQTST